MPDSRFKFEWKLIWIADDPLSVLAVTIVLKCFATVRKFCLVLPALLFPIAASQAADNAKAGKLVFRWCAACHQVGPYAHGGFAPQLNGLFGRRAGSTPHFKYSPAMNTSGIIWSEQTLSTFVRDPDGLVPENKMRFRGLGDDRQIADLLAYLRTFSAMDAGK